MPRTEPIQEIALVIPADLDVAGVSEAHAQLLSALAEAEASGSVASIELGGAAHSTAPLALQLLASAARSLPPAQMRLGTRAAAALAALHPIKETS